MALWSAQTAQVSGASTVYASSGPITAENRRHYLLNTTSNQIAINLPVGIDGFNIRITDANGTFANNNVIVMPAVGQKIMNLETDQNLFLNTNKMWVELTWNAVAGFWVVTSPGVLNLNAYKQTVNLTPSLLTSPIELQNITSTSAIVPNSVVAFVDRLGIFEDFDFELSNTIDNKVVLTFTSNITPLLDGNEILRISFLAKT